ncbi:MAG TPA: hypothetical protein VMP08_04235 [Anaerolineae bacterium]|nr:hypothetical protein [Anaerolineae bacterium]
MFPRLKVVFVIALIVGALVIGSLGQASSVNGQSQAATPELLDTAVAHGEISQEQADLYLAYALTDYEKLPQEYRSTVPWDGTLPLLHLQQRLQTMKPSAMKIQIAQAVSAICSSSTGSLPNNTSTAHFYVEYDTIGGGLTLNTYTTSLETTWTKEITTFGWAAPPLKTSNPPDSRYHVRIDTLGNSLYGYVSSSGDYAGFLGDNPNTAWNDADAYYTCMVLNRDYSAFPGTPQTALDATTGHEFNHSIQFGLGALTGSNVPDAAFTEGGASWMEDEVYDSSNDNYNYLWPDFTMCMGEYTASPYPYWITWRGLTERYGTGVASGGEQVMQDFWEETSKNTGDNLSAMQTALANKGTTLADAYHAYAIAAKFNKTCGGSYVYPYCFEEASGYLSAAGATTVQGAIASVGGSYSGSVQDNYALNWISLPTSGGPYTVTLQNNSAGGQLRASVVCDTGSALSVTPLPTVVSAGGSSSLASFNPSGCSSVVAVITNQSQTANNPTSCTARSYQLSTTLGGAATQYKTYLPLIRKDPPPLPSLANGNFESGATGWTEYSLHGWPIILSAGNFPGTITPHGGSWAAWLGGEYDDISYVQQSVGVQASAPYLAYWHWIASADVCGYDFGGVLVNGTVADVYTLCTTNNTGGWVKHVVNLSVYSGQIVTLQIRAETDSTNNSNLFVDDVAFQSSPVVAAFDAPPTYDPRATASRSVVSIPQSAHDRTTPAAKFVLRPR